LTVAFTLLVGCIQLAARLQRASVVAAVATDAAHHVAETGDRAEADRRIRRWLGADADVRWDAAGDQVRVEVGVAAPAVPGLDTTIRRTAAARREGAPCPADRSSAPPAPRRPGGR
jgi:hypothetical protein